MPLFLYRDDPARLLKAYKTAKRPSLAPFFTELLAEQILSRWPGRPIVPVPPRAEKIRRHEWDQVEEIARRLERKGFRLFRMLQRNRGREQKSLDKKNRSLNAKESYTLKTGMVERRRGSCSCWLDDICTTGSTIEACAQLLLGAGASRVAAIVIAAD